MTNDPLAPGRRDVAKLPAMELLKLPDAAVDGRNPLAGIGATDFKRRIRKP